MATRDWIYILSMCVHGLFMGIQGFTVFDFMLMCVHFYPFMATACEGLSKFTRKRTRLAAKGKKKAESRKLAEKLNAERAIILRQKGLKHEVDGDGRLKIGQATGWPPLSSIFTIICSFSRGKKNASML